MSSYLNAVRILCCSPDCSSLIIFVNTYTIRLGNSLGIFMPPPFRILNVKRYLAESFSDLEGDKRAQCKNCGESESSQKRACVLRLL